MTHKVFFFARQKKIVAALFFAFACFVMMGCPPPSKIKIKVDETVVKVGGSIKYGIAEGQAADSISWDFGDSSARAVGPTGLHKYYSKGKFLLGLFLEEKLADSMWITVIDSMTPSPDQPDIKGPDTGLTGQELTFTDANQGQTPTVWKFGESGKTDAKGENVTYIYKHPGKFTVTAVHDGKTAQAIKTIAIADTAKHLVANITNDTLLVALRDLSNPKNTPKDFKRFHERLKVFVCNNESIEVTINNAAKKVTFSNYCTRVNMLNPKIISVKATRTPDGCVTGLAVEEGQ